MYHSITFGDKNTYDDWKIVPKERPFFNPPPIKTNYVDIPGASSKLDFSEALTGYPLYENRTGSIEFYILNDLDDIHRSWHTIYSEIENYLHNKPMRAILEDDPMYFYEGRFFIDSYTPGNSESDSRSMISIGYDVGPYKWCVESSVDDNWLWDPFSFENGVIKSGFYKDLAANTSYQSVPINNRDLIGYAPINIKVNVTTNGSGMYLMFTNPDIDISKTIHVPDGETQIYDFVIYGVNSNLYYKTVSGTGLISIIFREGRL